MNQRGFVMILILIVVAILMALGVVFAQAATTETRLAVNMREGAAAFHIAEAGLERGLNTLAGNLTWREGLDWTDFGGGAYRLTVTADGGTITLTSTGTYVGARRDIEAVVRASVPLAFKRGIHCLTTMPMAGWVIIHGDAYIGGNLRISGRADIYGDLYISGSIPGPSQPTVTGEIIYDPEIQVLPEQDIDWYRERAFLELSGPLLLTGEIDFGDHLVIVDGNLTIGSPAKMTATMTGKTTLVVIGSVTVNRSILYDDPDEDMLTIIAFGDITFESDSTVEALFISYGSITSRGTLDVRGGLLATYVELTGSSRIVVDERFAVSPTPGSPGVLLQILDWGQTP